MTTVVSRENVVRFVYSLGAVLGGMYLERRADGLGDVGALIVASAAAVALVAYYNYRSH